MCLKIRKIDSAPGLAWQAALKKSKVKREKITTGRKRIRGGIYRCIYRYAKPSNKNMEDYEKNKESSYHQYWDVHNLYSWAMSQKLPGNNFGWSKGTSQFNKKILKKTISKKTMMKKVKKDIFLKLMFNILKNCMTFIMIYHFYLKKWKFKKSESL